MKRKILSMLLICSIILNICNLSVLAFSNSEQKRISELIDNSIVLSTQTPVCYVWGERTYVDKENLSVMPIIKNDRTLVPIRFVAESIGAKVNWDNHTQTATIISNADEIKITINSDYMYVNNQRIKLDVPAQIIQDRTLIPLRAVSESLDKNIFYHNGFILVSDYDINLDNADSDIQNIVEYLRYTMLVYDKDDSSKISFMKKTVGENNLSAIYTKQIPFESDRNKLISVTGGMYIENLKCVDAGNNHYTISMDVYNTSYTYGAVEFYNADGAWLGSSKIDKYESIGTSLENTLSNAWEGTFGIGWAIGNGIMGDWSDLQYRNGTISKYSYIQKTVPKGSFLYITNNIKESPYVAMYDMVSIAVDSVSLASDWIDVFKGGDEKKFLDAAKENIMEELSDEVFETVITNTEFANIIAADYSLGSISDYINNVVEKTVTILEDNNIDIAKSLQDTALKIGKDIAVGTTESLLKKAMSFIGTALDVCFNIGKTCDFASFIADIRKATDSDPLLLVAGYEEQNEYVPNVTFSASIGEVNGKIYCAREASYEVSQDGLYQSQNVPTCELLPIETSKFGIISSFCYYDGYVYYIESEGGSTDYSSWLYRCKPDWTGKELLDEIKCNWETLQITQDWDNYQEGERFFVIDNGVLYYDTYDPDTETTAINLSTMQKYKSKRPKYVIRDNGITYDRSWENGYDIAIYNDITFFTDKNNNLYKMEDGNKLLLATNAYLDGGCTSEYLYYAEFNWEKSQDVKLYRVPLNGGNKEFIDSKMPAGGGGPYFCW